jgi:hypothetical protein
MRYPLLRDGDGARAGRRYSGGSRYRARDERGWRWYRSAMRGSLDNHGGLSLGW